jgi:hypothetical protein
MKMKQSIVALLCLSALVLFSLSISLETQARPGGGSSYSGGGSGSSGSSGGSSSYSGGDSSSDGGDGEMPIEIAIPFMIIMFIFFLYNKKNENSNKVSSSNKRRYTPKFHADIDAKIKSLKKRDPNFSKTLFLEFACSLYHKQFHYRNKPEFNNLKPYLSDTIFNAGKTDAKNDVTFKEIVIGNASIRGMQKFTTYDMIVVQLEANYTLTTPYMSTRFIVTDRLSFYRDPELKSKEPKYTFDLPCPNCAAPANFTDSGECTNCNTLINKGEMQWYLGKIVNIQKQVFKVEGLTHYAQEVGTDRITKQHENLLDKATMYKEKYGIEDWKEHIDHFYDNTVKTTFIEIYTAWSDQNWDSIRHLVSDRLFETNQFWIDNYKAAGLVNKLDDIEISKCVVSNIEMDTYYDTITIRVFASCKDYVVDGKGKVKGGSSTKDRKFSEYWTFIRRAGITEKNADLKHCPNCNAAADKIGQSAICGYCDTKINTGEFSWVLSIMTQDEVYTV